MNVIVFLAKTPVWVWFVLAYVLFVGYKSLRPRSVKVYQLAVMPLIFLSMKYAFFMNASSSDVSMYKGYAILGGFIGWYVGLCEEISFSSDGSTVNLPPNYYTLPLLGLFFIFKFFLGYVKSTDLSLYSHFQTAEIVTSACIFGFFFGKNLSIRIRYKQR